MSAVEHRVGDLFDADDADALAHGCNCAGAMGRGIAVEFRRRWPDMYAEYRRRCREGVLTPGGIFVWQIGQDRFVYNLGTQAHWRTAAKLPDVEAAIRAMVADAAGRGVRRIAMPRIGAGLGRLPWADVEGVLGDALGGSGVTVVVYTLPEDGLRG